MTNLTTDKSKTDKSNFGQVENIFPFSHSDKSKPSKSISFFQLFHCLSYMNALVIEGSQIIAFLAYQPLTLPPQIALSPTPFFRLLLAITYHT